MPLAERLNGRTWTTAAPDAVGEVLVLRPINFIKLTFTVDPPTRPEL